ncbi:MULTISPECIES: hypothetical protein [Cohnella]|uniref:hypothetical protein n=1 Tax=Cohnella TaxID=329857 RepID=UPI00111990E7|nr:MULTISPECIES: hypothetical protein [Cohnella]MBN2984315.1 hypothetical protein [Cohnella algarum]
MSFLRAWLGLAAFGFVLAVALGQFAAREPLARDAGESAAVFTPIRVSKMSDDTIVDAFIKLPFANRLTRVIWENGILSVDLTLSPESDRPERLWNDVRQIVGLSFERMPNVRQVLLRFFREDERGRTLLVSADSRAGDWTASDLAGLDREAAGERAPAWTEKLRLSWTTDGKRWAGNITNE